MFPSRRFSLFRPKEIEMSRWKRVLLSMLIVTIDPSKDAESYIVDDEAVRSNRKLLRSGYHTQFFLQIPGAQTYFSFTKN